MVNIIHVPNKQLIKIKRNIIQLLNELVDNNVIIDEFVLVSKSGKKINLLIDNLTTYYITKLWKDTSDIEFVRQSIGHLKIETTSKYIQELTEEERKSRINLIN